MIFWGNLIIFISVQFRIKQYYSSHARWIWDDYRQLCTMHFAGFLPSCIQSFNYKIFKGDALQFCIIITWNEVINVVCGMTQETCTRLLISKLGAHNLPVFIEWVFVLLKMLSTAILMVDTEISKQIIKIEQRLVKNPDWQDTHQLAIHKAWRS